MYLILFVLLNFNLMIPAATFDNKWRDMQHIYTDFKTATAGKIEKYTIPLWNQFTETMAKLIMGAPNHNYLVQPPICPAMLRLGFSETTQFELNFLNHLLSVKNTNLLNQYEERVSGGLIIDCPQRNCATNTVGQMFYLGKILNQIDYEKISTFVEFGGGYGCLARITKSLLPEVTYIIIDLPETLAIQYLYLSTTLNGVDIVTHTSLPLNIKKGCINLIPISFIEVIDLDTDIFASNFALSESPYVTQNIIINKKFFNASVCYITGQVDSWGPNNKWRVPDHSVIINAIEQLYSNSYKHPFHTFNGPVASYEVIGVKRS